MVNIHIKNKRRHASLETRSIKENRVIENNLCMSTPCSWEDVLGCKEICSIIFET